MLKNLIKISLRLITRNRTYSIINFFGLSLGLFVFILIYLYVTHELSYDRYHKNYNTIFRVYKESENDYMGSNKFAITQAPVADVIRQQVPDVIHATRIMSSGNLLIHLVKESFFENQFYAIDPDAFKIFTFDIAAGNRKDILENPKSVVIDETLAKKYFGSPENAIGRTIKAETYLDLGEFIVESVIKDMPANSHFRMRMIFQFEAIVKATQPSDLTSWSNSNYYNYVNVKPGTDIRAAELKLQEAVKSNLGEKPPVFRFQPLREIYLGPSLNFDIAPTGSMSMLYVFSCIGALVLLIACINYTNMATACASNRAKEIGLRKVSGAQRSELIVQFVGEAVFMTVLAVLVSCVAVVLILPYFNTFLEKDIRLSVQDQLSLVIALAGLVVLVGIMAGIYPALILSRLNPVRTLKGAVKTTKGFYLRDSLVLIQFVISGVMIFATLAVWGQMQFIENKDLGFNREQIVIVRLRDKAVHAKISALKQKLLQNPDILKVAASSRIPSQVSSNQGRTWQIKGESRDMQTYYSEIDSSFLGLYEIKLLTGRNLSAVNHHNDVIMNESLVKELGYTNEEIIGTLFAHGDSSHVIGVIQDFHFQDFKQKIQPLRLRSFVSSAPGYLSLKVNEANMKGTLEYMEESLRRFSEKYPFEYFFYDDLYNRAYVSEIKTGKMMGWFAGVAIFIATLGLYGLVLFVANQRLREISIRKVLGASGISILRLLSSRFVVLVMIGYALACTIGYYGMEKWLSEFVYRIPLNFGIFALTLLVMIAITGLTIFFRVRHATSINPAVVLKQE